MSTKELFADSAFATLGMSVKRLFRRRARTTSQLSTYQKALAFHIETTTLSAGRRR